MLTRRLLAFGTIATSLAAGAGSALAQVPQVLETRPADRAVLRSAPGEFYVRFDRPVDHIRSRLMIKQNGAVIRTFQPRLKTEPDVLFAMVFALQPGDYAFHWSVRALTGTDVLEGEIPFSVSAGQ